MKARCQGCSLGGVDYYFMIVNAPVFFNCKGDYRLNLKNNLTLPLDKGGRERLLSIAFYLLKET